MGYQQYELGVRGICAQTVPQQQNGISKGALVIWHQKKGTSKGAYAIHPLTVRYSKHHQQRSIITGVLAMRHYCKLHVRRSASREVALQCRIMHCNPFVIPIYQLMLSLNLISNKFHYSASTQYLLNCFTAENLTLRIVKSA